MIYLTINGQEMTGTMTDKLVSGQVNFVDVKTFFDSSWDGLNKSYQFKNGDRVVELESNDEIIQLPYEATLNAGCMEINVFGTLLDTDGVTVLRKATANFLRFKVIDSNAVDDPDNIGDVSATVVEQIRKMAEDTDARVDELIEDLENGVYNTGGGSGGEGGITKETDPTVPSWAKQPSKPTYNKSEVGLGAVDNVKQYSVNNPPPYPVNSVNGKTGNVVINIPTKTSELDNDSNYASTYYVDNEIATFDFIKVVDSLPTTGLPNRIYFVPKSDSETQDLFDEYAWVNDNWEFITTKQMEVDLTNYATKDELNVKQDTLVSGKNIKTINGQSIVGAGNIPVEGGSGGGGNPTGTIISFMGLIAPDGYLICDGSELNISVFPDLANHFETQFGTKNHFGGDGETTFALPDLRNEFLRGYHGGASEQFSGEVGIHQGATEIPNMWTYDDMFCASYIPDAAVAISNQDAKVFDVGKRQVIINADTKNTSAGQYGKSTVRPTNVAVLYCIKT